MNIHVKPDTLTKLDRLGNLTQHEPAGDEPQREKTALLPCISHVTTPQGQKPILKAMLTTACERNCHYCVFRAGRTKTERVNFTPDEMAKSFDTLQQSKQVDGAFLSSGIIRGSVTTQDKILDTAAIIRSRYQYRGYLHLKLMPGAEYDQILRAMQLADRVSVNLEGPTEARLNLLAPKKDFLAELLDTLQTAAAIRRNHADQKIASITTQFVVGAVGDTDLELLSLSQRLYQQLGLTRAYYMAFSPVEQTPFENLSAVDQ
ncbi:MAG: radical SAM protein, partial [Anaerolineae bacterium]|nr:radical SAM protein [Anaerolineae bacterium]